MRGPACIAQSAADKPEVTLWECPCWECTKMAWEADDSHDMLSEHRREWWPEFYPPMARKGATVLKDIM